MSKNKHFDKLLRQARKRKPLGGSTVITRSMRYTNQMLGSEIVLMPPPDKSAYIGGIDPYIADEMGQMEVYAKPERWTKNKPARSVGGVYVRREIMMDQIHKNFGQQVEVNKELYMDVPLFCEDTKKFTTARQELAKQADGNTSPESTGEQQSHLESGPATSPPGTKSPKL